MVFFIVEKHRQPQQTFFDSIADALRRTGEPNELVGVLIKRVTDVIPGLTLTRKDAEVNPDAKQNVDKLDLFANFRRGVDGLIVTVGSHLDFGTAAISTVDEGRGMGLLKEELPRVFGVRPCVIFRTTHPVGETQQIRLTTAVYPKNPDSRTWRATLDMTAPNVEIIEEQGGSP